mmetsp:Transcript_33651/g.68849  ORF Transcript_33651/g.68849 Transcript_33651/m.68849 type:complete len:414 (-) Transcript_33651:479-1720(-)
MSENVAKLRVCILVNASLGTDAEVAPARNRTLKLNSFDLATCGLKTIIWVLCSNARGNHMAIWIYIPVLQEVDRRGGVRVALTVETPDLRNVLQWDTATDQHLCSRQIHPGELLCDRMFHLQSWIQLEKVELVLVCIVQVLHCSCPDVANVLCEALGSTFHLQESVLWHHYRRSFLKYLLEASLGRAISTIQCHSISMLISDDLHLNVPSTLAKLHHEDRRSWNFILHLDEAALQVFLLLHHSDPFSSSTFGGFDHHGESNAFDCFLGLLHRTHCAFPKNVLWNGTIRAQIGFKTFSTPRNGWNASRLCQDVGRNLVTQHRHHGRGGANEGDAKWFQTIRKFGILRSMSPARPYSIHALRLGNIHNEVNIGIVVDVFSSRDFNVGICQSNEFGICLQILGSGHDDEFKHIVRA